MKTQLIFPMALYVLFMWISAVRMFRSRLHSVKSGQVPLKYYRAHLGQQPDEKVILAGRHYDNQFQVPILFFITCLFHFQIGMVNWMTIGLCWLFVISRAVHSWILLGRNLIQYRVAAFAFGWIMVLSLWVQLVYFALVQSGQ